MTGLSPLSRTPTTALEVLRVARGLSREQLGAKALVSARTIFAIEHQQRKASSATQTVLAAALDTRREVLFPDA
jgi:DNA-binding XRE family transcriptional regulator